MGADIHSMAEVKWEDKWEEVNESIWPYPYFRADLKVGYWNVPYAPKPLTLRNYTMFALLADVRNYYGITPISSLRGVPEDASQGWKDYVKKWGVDLHSHTWYTHKELKEYRDSLPARGNVEFSDGIKSYEALFGKMFDEMLAPLEDISYPVRYVMAFDN